MATTAAVETAVAVEVELAAVRLVGLEEMGGMVEGRVAVASLVAMGEVLAVQVAALDQHKMNDRGM